MPFLRRQAPPPQEPRSLRGLVERLNALPQTPVESRHPRNWVFRVKRATDFIGHSRPDWARFFRTVNPYPKPFEHVRFRTEDGVSIAGWYGPPRRTSPDWGLVIVPGMFSTKDDTAHKRRTIRIWRAWRVPVLVIDMRAFGESTGIATAGWKEAFDVHAACQELKRRSGVARVGVLAESLGGAAALNALAHDAQQETPVMDGGTLCFSAFADARDAVSYISERPPRGDDFFVTWQMFRRLLRLRSRGAYERFDDLLEEAALANGLEGIDALFDLANPKWKVGTIHAPTLLVHATNDPVVPVRHARRMERYARDLEHVRVIVTPWGGHTGFEALDPWWFWEVARRFFGEINGSELPNLAELARRPARHGQEAAGPTAPVEAT